MSSDTPTPRTDAMVKNVFIAYPSKNKIGRNCWVRGSGQFVRPDDCRQLERELAAATERIAALKRERDTAIQHLGKQSRDAGLLEDEVERLTRQRDALILGLESGRASWKEENDALRALLRECALFLDPSYDGDNFDPPEIRKRIRAALGEEER